MPIELKNVSHNYLPGTAQAVPSLHGLSLRIEDGEFVGVMGRTGCGKSTMIQLLAGLLSPTEGSVWLDGADVGAKSYDRSVLRRSVGLVFQYPEYQLFETTVEKDVAFGLKHSGLSRAEIAERVRWALDAMDFDFQAVRAQPPLSLSGGEKRRVAIAGVLASRPKILIFDEPIAGLDPLGRESFLKLVTRLNREGTTILMVSHNADAIGEYAKRLVVLDGGRLVADGRPAAVFADVESMKKLRLGVSVSCEIAGALRQRGLHIADGVVSYAGLLSSLKAALGSDSA